MSDQYNEIKAKVKLVQKPLSEWNNGCGSYVPLYGEICFCEIYNVDTTKPPIVLFKMGDGKRTFRELNWVSAEAADVHSWAKQDENKFIDWLLENLPLGEGLKIFEEQNEGSVEKKLGISEEITFIIDCN